MARMARRVKSKRLSILRLSEDFQRSRREQTLKLQSQLGTLLHGGISILLAHEISSFIALHHAQGEKMFNTRLALLMSNDTSLPAYEVGKEVHLARVRSQKADLLEKCHVRSSLWIRNDRITFTLVAFCCSTDSGCSRQVAEACGGGRRSQRPGRIRRRAALPRALPLRGGDGSSAHARHLRRAPAAGDAAQCGAKPARSGATGDCLHQHESGIVELDGKIQTPCSMEITCGQI